MPGSLYHKIGRDETNLLMLGSKRVLFLQAHVTCIGSRLALAAVAAGKKACSTRAHSSMYNPCPVEPYASVWTGSSNQGKGGLYPIGCLAEDNQWLQLFTVTFTLTFSSECLLLQRGYRIAVQMRDMSPLASLGGRFV